MGEGETTMVNKFAEMVAAGNYSTYWVCQCCMLMHANAECCDSEQHGGDGCVPLSEVPATADTSLGQLWEEHDLTCLRRTGDFTPDDYECDCDRREFSWSSCEGCGSGLAGSRHALFVVYDMRPAVEVAS